MLFAFYNDNFTSKPSWRSAEAAITATGKPGKRTWSAYMRWRHPVGYSGEIKLTTGQFWSVLSRLQALEHHLTGEGVLGYKQHVLILCPQHLSRSIKSAITWNCDQDRVVAKELAVHLPTSLVGHYQFPD